MDDSYEQTIDIRFKVNYLQWHGIHIQYFTRMEPSWFVHTILSAEG